MIRRAGDMQTEQRDGMRGGNGTVTIKHFFKADEFTASSRLCAQLTLPPGASIGPHQHESEDEVYIITKGSGVLDDTHTQTPVGVGDAILTGNGQSHAIRNDGKGDLEIVAMIMRYGAHHDG